jgi:hypothetical protein
MKIIKVLAAVLTAAVISSGCKKDKVADTAPEKPFVITDYFIAGTTAPKSSTNKYKSVFFIRFLEDNKALFINTSANNLSGTYTVTDNEIVFEVTGGNARIAKFALDVNKKVTSAYYKALTTEYEATGELLQIKDTNELAGKTFKGEEFKMDGSSNRTGLTYSFNNAGFTTYGSGTDAASIDKGANNYTLIGGSGFKYVNGSNVELGFVANKQLTVFRVSGLYYYGKYSQQ